MTYVVDTVYSDGFYSQHGGYITATEARSEALKIAKNICKASDGSVDQLYVVDADTIYRVHYGDRGKFVDVSVHVVY